jgi:precorrin-6Y C5,15-methyltransferase (decarboxylating)
MSLPDAIARETAASPRWLSIVGIGEDGVDGLGAAARGVIGAAEIVYGGRRHLSLAGPLIRGAARPWPSPFDGADEEVLRHRGRQVCVLASGDPFHYGIGATLARRIDAREMLVVPAPSAFSLAAARLGWSLPQTALLSVHGRTLDLVRPHLQPGARILALTSDGEGAAALAKLLTDIGFGASRPRCWRRSAARSSKSAPRPRRRSISAPSMRSTRWRSKSSLRPVRASSPARPDSPMISSSTTARSPSARCAP